MNTYRYTENPHEIVVGDIVTTIDYSYSIGTRAPQNPMNSGVGGGWHGYHKWTVTEVSPAAGPIPKGWEGLPRLNMKIKQIDGSGELWIYSAFLKLVERAKPVAPADPIVGYVKCSVLIGDSYDSSGGKYYTYAVPESLKHIKLFEDITVPFGVGNTERKARAISRHFTPDSPVPIKTVLYLGEPKPKTPPAPPKPKQVTYKDLWDQKHGELFESTYGCRYVNTRYGVLFISCGVVSDIRPKLDDNRSSDDILTHVPGVTYSLSLTRKETA